MKALRPRYTSLLFLLLAALLSAGLFYACTVGDDDNDNTSPTAPTGTDRPPIRGSLVVNPSAVNVTVLPSYSGGGQYYFYAVGGTAPYYWSQSNPRIGSIAPLADYNDGIQRKCRYTLNGFSGEGNDIIMVRDGAGASISATMSLTAGVPKGLTVTPTSVTFSSAQGGEQAVFTVSGGISPYYWTKSFTSTFSTLTALSADGMQALYTVAASPTAGTETVSVFDSLGSSATATVTVQIPTTPPSVLTVTANVSTIYAGEDPTGTVTPSFATLTASGGTPPYVWALTPAVPYASLSAVTGSSTAILTAITNNNGTVETGTAVVTVTDANGTGQSAMVAVTVANY